MKVWLSPEILEWNVEVFGNFPAGGIDFFTPYYILEHVKKKLVGVDDEGSDDVNYDLGDAIKSLREVVENREKQLLKKFSLKKLPFDKPKATYQILLQLGITQPLMQEKLVKLRNVIVHEQKYPSTKHKKRILEFWEFVWYFIRATDSFLSRRITSMFFYPDEINIGYPINLEDHENGCVYIYIGPKKNWEITVLGRNLSASLFSRNAKQSWMEVDVEDFNNAEDFKMLTLEDFTISEDKAKAREKNALFLKMRQERIAKLDSMKSVKSFRGEIVGPTERLKELIEQYIELYMYY
jgi:hypothetical protein